MFLHWKDRLNDRHTHTYRYTDSSHVHKCPLFKMLHKRSLLRICWTKWFPLGFQRHSRRKCHWNPSENDEKQVIFAWGTDHKSCTFWTPFRFPGFVLGPSSFCGPSSSFCGPSSSVFVFLWSFFVFLCSFFIFLWSFFVFLWTPAPWTPNS